jgi:poly(3-hydroxybutyrate) depolymerase
MQRATGLSAVADRRGFLVAYPQALRQEHGRGPPGWDASGPGDPFADGIDDGLYISDVLNALQAGYCVEPARITATGISNGGSMAGYLACVLAGRIADFAPVEGVFFQIPGGCHPAHPAAILDVHVLTDPVAPYAGVPSRGSPDYYALAIPAWLRAWAFRDGCRGGPRPLRSSAATAGGPGPAAIAGERWVHCPAGVAVTGLHLTSGGHTWFRMIGADAGNGVILRFFAAHPLRAATGSWTPRPGAPAISLTAPTLAIRSLRHFRVPTSAAEPFDIAAGSGGSMWFTEFHADKIGRISPSGAITEFRVPTAGAGPYQIAAGPDGSMWFTEYNTTKIGRVSSTGRVTEIQMPRPAYGRTGITGSPAGPVWVADPGGFIDRITPAGAVTRKRLPARGVPFAIAQSVTGGIWVSELTGYFEYSRVLLHLHAASGGPISALNLFHPDLCQAWHMG